ncbi:MAG: ATP-binding protein, partial [Candidatus Thermoplasmatota archaeon]|nr:ATP-binding protein [Candidatus Thermoplasmatota archaeon]
LMKKHGGVYVNFEDERLYNFSLEDFDKLYDMALATKSKKLYLDEVQAVEGWEKFAHRAHRKVKLFVTGSNSKLLSSDYSSSLVGRTKSFTVMPLSYGEFLRFRGSKPGKNSVMDYMDLGGFPRIALTGDVSLAGEYLDRIIYRDIIGKERVLHPEAIKTLALYLLSNVGNEFSYRSLRSVCGVKHENTVKEYLRLLREAFLVETVNKYHSSLKAQESYGKKIYAVDPALMRLGKRFDGDRGRMLENIIYLHLKRLFGDVYFGKNGKEVDFIICKGLKPMKVFNVTYQADAEETFEREMSSLEYFMDLLGVPGEIVSVYPGKTTGGAEFRLAHRFLMENAQSIA